MTNWIEAKTDREKKRLVQNQNPCWDNLADGFCPLCDGHIEPNMHDDMTECVDCQFSISMDKLEEIIQGIEDKEFYGTNR